MYTVLVAEPGIARKTQAINFGLGILSEVPGVHTASDAITPQAMILEIEEAREVEEDGFQHSSLTIVSREFESFLGQKQENTKMLTLLTDLFDCQELPWTYRTKGSGTNTLVSLYLNLLGATTPDSLASSLPTTAIGGGLTSRILFIWADKKHKKVTRPSNDPESVALKRTLIKDLFAISRLNGEYEFSEDAFNKWDKWYTSFDEQDPNRLCKDPSFSGWYSRKPMYIQKVAMLVAASRSNKLILEWRDFQDAIKILEEAESLMENVFKAIGKSNVTVETDMITKIVKNAGWIKEEDLLSMVWRDMDARKFDNVVNTARRSGKIIRKFKGPAPANAVGIWYCDADLDGAGKK
jgi:hypothetical protein